MNVDEIAAAVLAGAEQLFAKRIEPLMARIAELEARELPKDGIGLAGAMIDRDGELILTNTKGETIRLGKVVGKDGADGLGFDDMQAETDGEGNVTLKLVRGGIVKEFPLSFAVPVYKGYWRQGTKAAKGNVLTHKGNAWIALTDTQDEPTRENKTVWQILAAKGSDGRDGKDGRDLGAPGSVKLNG